MSRGGQHVISSADAGQRIDRWLRKLLAEVPLPAIYRHLRAGRIRVDGGKVDGSLRLTEGMNVELRLPPADLTRLQAGADLGETTPLARLIAADVEFHCAVYRLCGNPVIEATIAPQWPHMRRSMATVLDEFHYRADAWREHEMIARRILIGDAAAAETAARDHALAAGRMTEARLRAAA